MEREIFNDFENIARYGDRWHLLRKDIAAGLARPVPEEELQRLEADYEKLKAELQARP